VSPNFFYKRASKKGEGGQDNLALDSIINNITSTSGDREDLHGVQESFKVSLIEAARTTYVKHFESSLQALEWRKTFCSVRAICYGSVSTCIKDMISPLYLFFLPPLPLLTTIDTRHPIQR
jgi:hypothetical protein